MNFDFLDGILGVVFIVLLVSVPLGVWKLIEILGWFFSHVRWG